MCPKPTGMSRRRPKISSIPPGGAQFQDPVLDRLIAEALAGNKNIKIAAANVEQAEAVLMQVRAPLFPQFGYSGSDTRERPSGTLYYVAFPAGGPSPRQPTRPSARQAGSLISGAASGGRQRRRAPTCLPRRKRGGA